MNAKFIIQELLSVANPEKAKFLQRFFKTGKGEYAERDVMLGIVAPLTRDIVKRSPKLPFNEIQILVDSEYHEVR
ncbi:MAG: DNA alkylation repair protein, partial [Bacteroidales bacterium]|nr:DNA alkylation repair protein [Bacteroidales bacterium]